MAHFSHPRELATEVARRAVARIRVTGAVIYTPGPADPVRSTTTPASGARCGGAELAVGMMPYYMFVERDTGPQDYFAGAAGPRPSTSSATPTRTCPAWPARCAGRSCRPPRARCCVDGVERDRGRRLLPAPADPGPRPPAGRPAVPGPLVGRRGLAERPGDRPGCPGGHPRRRQPQRGPPRRGRHRRVRTDPKGAGDGRPEDVPQPRARPTGRAADRRRGESDRPPGLRRVPAAGLRAAAAGS